MHNISNLFYFGTTLYMFQTVFPSIIRSLRLYVQHQVYVIPYIYIYVWYNVYVIHTSMSHTYIHTMYMSYIHIHILYTTPYIHTIIPVWCDAVCIQSQTPDDGWRNRPKHVNITRHHTDGYIVCTDAQTTYSHIPEYDEACTPISSNCPSTVIDP